MNGQYLAEILNDSTRETVQNADTITNLIDSTRETVRSTDTITNLAELNLKPSETRLENLYSGRHGRVK